MNTAFFYDDGTYHTLCSQCADELGIDDDEQITYAELSEDPCDDCGGESVAGK